MPDDLAPEQLEQLARSLAMSTALTESDRLAVVEVLRAAAERERVRAAVLTQSLNGPYQDENGPEVTRDDK